MIETALIIWACLIRTIQFQIKVEIQRLAQEFLNERCFPRIAG